jgi:hypothetical protein
VLGGAVLLLAGALLLSSWGILPFLPATLRATPAEVPSLNVPPTASAPPSPSADLSVATPGGATRGSTLPPGSPQVKIADVYNAGREEHVTISNVGESDADLSGWSISGSRGKQRYTYPRGYILPAGQSMNLYSGEGGTSHPPSDVYWTAEIVWNNDGETVYLWDAAGNLADEYTY